MKWKKNDKDRIIENKTNIEQPGTDNDLEI